MKKVIVVNGGPRAGKDTSIAFMQGILQQHRVASMQFSSIDPIRAAVANMGIDTRGKTPEDRALLAEIGSAVEKHSGFRSKECVAHCLRFFASHREAVVFLHVREPEVIRTIGAALELAGCKLLSVIVVSNRAEKVASNAADLGVHDMEYDATLSNNSSLSVLEANCRCLLHTLDLIPVEEALP